MESRPSTLVTIIATGAIALAVFLYARRKSARHGEHARVYHSRWARRLPMFWPRGVRDDDWLRIPLFFHAVDLRELLQLGPRSERAHFDVAECAESESLCVPQHLVDWQQTIRDYLPPNWPPRWRSCAVVGSSNSLMHRPNARLIDTAAAVFRMNDAPTAGFAAYVGNKTTLRFWGAPRRSRHFGTVRWGVSAGNARHGAAAMAAADAEDGVVHVMACPPARIWQWADRCWDELHLANHTRLRAWLRAGRTLDFDGAAALRVLAREDGGRGLSVAQRRAVASPRLSPNVSVVLRQEMRRRTRLKAVAHKSMRWLNGYPTTGVSLRP